MTHTCQLLHLQTRAPPLGAPLSQLKKAKKHPNQNLKHQSEPHHFFRRAVNQKVLLEPGMLWAPTSPLINSASRRVIASPRPLPPYLRVVELSACSKGLNSRGRISGWMPMPFARVRKWDLRTLPGLHPKINFAPTLSVSRIERPDQSQIITRPTRRTTHFALHYSWVFSTSIIFYMQMVSCAYRARYQSGRIIGQQFSGLNPQKSNVTGHLSTFTALAAKSAAAFVS